MLRVDIIDINRCLKEFQLRKLSLSINMVLGIANEINKIVKLI